MKRSNYLQKQVAEINKVYKCLMELVMIDGSEETALQTIETTCLAEMEMFDLWAISMSDFIKIKISHFSGQSKIAKENIARYGEKAVAKYVEILEKLLKIKEER